MRDDRRPAVALGKPIADKEEGKGGVGGWASLEIIA
jgi:hypothetical protein